VIKQVCEEFETSHPLGRFIDVDLNDQQGDTVSSGKSKICFFCLERPSIECRREKHHEPEELRAFMFSKMEAYCHQQHEEFVIRKLSSLALNAILTEISLTPKPGLVDKLSNGSHSDMNYQAFISSSAAISQGFSELVRAGLTFTDNDLPRALPVIRKIGLEMETAMFDATNEVNTQKGIIFLMGLCLFTCGMIIGQSAKFDKEEFRFVIKNICKDLIYNELINRQQSVNSHGEVVFKKYNFGGARSEAESGFRTVFEFGLPQIIDCDRLNDEVMTKSFLAIASKNLDTNILYRSNFEVLSHFQKICKIALEDFSDENYSNVIDYCKKENISPGGSADLLAVTIFVWSVEKHLAWGVGHGAWCRMKELRSE
jgi:holo-ACP synthase/triphosphoribosyl-dephospho-CoA synthase